MPWRSRWFALATVCLAYVGWAAVRSSDQPRLRFVALVALLFGHAYVWVQALPIQSCDPQFDQRARTWVRIGIWGAALYAACQLGTHTSLGLLAATILGATASATAALVTLAGLPAPGGLLAQSTRPRRRDLAILCALVGFLSAAAPVTKLAGRIAPWIDDATVHAITAAGTLTQLILMLGITHSWAQHRKLEIGVSERLTAAWQLALGGLILAAPAALVASPRTETAVAALGTVIVALSLCGCAASANPVRVRLIQRVVMTVLVIAIPVSLVLASISFREPSLAPPATVLAVACGVAVGLFAVPLVRGAAPETARWLEAIRNAAAAAQRLDPDDALTSAMTALREVNQASPASPELWRIDPPELLTVDRAGYAHRTGGLRPPNELVSFAQLEPERTLQTSVLESVEVRRADVREVAKWLRERDGFCTTVVDDGQSVLGLLVLPAVTRHAPLTLEEAHGLHVLADRLASILSASSALARSRARELVTREKVEQLEEHCRTLESELELRRGRHELHAQRTARAALVAKYSNAGRKALERIRELGRTSPHAALVAPAGIDPAPSAAVLHLASARKTGPLLVVHAEDLPDCTIVNATLARADAATPLPTAGTPLPPISLAAGGSLVIVDAIALSHAQQDATLATLDLMRGGAVLAPGLIICLPADLDVLAADGTFTAAFAGLFRDRVAELPPLAARPEDLRGILLDRIARVGLRTRGRPFGLTPSALEQLIEHAWPGNDLELEDVLTRAALHMSGECITVADLRRIGFSVVAPHVNTSSCT